MHGLSDYTGMPVPDYTGMPVSRHQRLDATLQRRRRIRTFTVLVTSELNFDDVRVVPR